MLNKSIWERLCTLTQKNTLPHALLFCGVAGTGKITLARNFAAALLCPAFATRNQSCGECHNCHLMKAGHHPDFMEVTSEPGHAIKIDQIRELTEFASGTSMQNGYKVILIHPANAMNINASNALLKTLEEPSPHTILILITDSAGQLSATIRSRCQKIVFNKSASEHQPSLSNDENDFRKLIYSAFTNPNCDPLQIAKNCLEKDIHKLLNWIMLWNQDLLRMKIAGNVEKVINKDYQNFIFKMAERIPSKDLLRYVDYIQQVYVSISKGYNLNRQLLLEEIFINWSQIALQ